jgi:hypothetical protein
VSDFWITTHWPAPLSDPALSRNVYVKAHSITLPQPGDVVFIRESIHALDKHGRRVRTAVRHHRGQTARLDVPKGTGGIVGVATVDGAIREQVPNDVVFDYGDLREWRVIPCRDFQAAHLPLSELLNLLAKHNPRFLSLWRIPNPSLGQRILRSLRR